MPLHFIDRDDVLALITAAFTRRDKAYPEKKKAAKTRLKPLEAQLETLQANGRAMSCSEQILLEAQWLIGYSDDWPRVADRSAALEKSLGNLDQPGPAQDKDGSFGGCYTEWYRKLEPTVDTLQQDDLDPASLKPLRFMKRLENPERTIDYLYRLQTTDIAATGRNNRDELGAVQTALSQLIFKDELRELLHDNKLGFRISPRLVDTYLDYLHQTQHPRTGYWGPWYRFGDRLVMVQDLSSPFHIVQYRSGNIRNWPLLIDTTFAIKKLTYPAGWRPSDGADYSNHNNYDILTLLAFGWPHMRDDQKTRARSEIQAMLEWCLTTSVQGDGFDLAGESAIVAYYFGVRFLDRAGFWDSAKRFWTRRLPPPLPGAPGPAELAQRLQRGFDKLADRSEEGETVRSILRAAACLAAPVSGVVSG